MGDKEQLVESTKEIPTGAVILGASFVREGDWMPTTGTLSLFIDDEKVGEGQIMTQPGNFSLVGEGLNVGKDPASRSPTTTRAPARTRSPAARSRRRSSTSRAITTSTWRWKRSR